MDIFLALMFPLIFFILLCWAKLYAFGTMVNHLPNTTEATAINITIKETNMNGEEIDIILELLQDTQGDRQWKN